eukprot:jgi/Mesen1/9402/ME000614S08652
MAVPSVEFKRKPVKKSTSSKKVDKESSDGGLDRDALEKLLLGDDYSSLADRGLLGVASPKRKRESKGPLREADASAKRVKGGKSSAVPAPVAEAELQRKKNKKRGGEAHSAHDDERHLSLDGRDTSREKRVHQLAGKIHQGEDKVREAAQLKGHNSKKARRKAAASELDAMLVHEIGDLPIEESDAAPLEIAPLDVELEAEAGPGAGLESFDEEEREEGDEQEQQAAEEKEGDAHKQQRKRQRRREKEDREKATQAAEARMLQGRQLAPESADEFERVVMASPSSSYVWIQYMAHWLRLAEVDKARAIAARALATIHYREEQEKLNVWIALLNLESVHGSPPKEAVQRVFERACQQCDPKPLYLALLAVLERCQLSEAADEALKAMLKKFKTSSKVWLKNVECLLKRGQPEEAHAALQRSLLSLPYRKHIKVSSRTALLMFRQEGAREQARTLMETILREHPKRLDLWSLYLDQEIKQGDVESVRTLFERATCLSLPPKKMKSILKKYLGYEMTHGDEESVQRVKEKALAYAEGSTLAAQPSY